VKRRDFIALLGSVAAAWPLAARAQQPAMPVVGVVTSLSSSFMERYAPALREGLNEAGYIDGRNVAVEYRSAEGYYDRLPGLVAELIDHKAAVIVAVGGSDPARIAKRPARSQLFLPAPPIPSRRALSPASIDPEATSPA
jgi:putative ABC transport system substrate-binding protein